MNECPLCGFVGDFLPFGIVPRPAAQCPRCGTVERHRAVALLLPKLALPKGPILHFSPEEPIAKLLREIGGDGYVGVASKEVMDIQAIDAPDESFMGIFASHVLEHVGDDAMALRECHRVLRDGGWALFAVPIIGEKTEQFENVTTPEERERVYGHRDHVRNYGRDILRLFDSAWFDVTVYPVSDVATPEQIDRYSLRCEPFYFCRKP